MSEVARGRQDGDVELTDISSPQTDGTNGFQPAEVAPVGSANPQTFSPQKSQIDGEEEYDIRFEDDDEEGDCCGGCSFIIVSVRSALVKFCIEHKLYIEIALLVSLVLLYFAYFGFAIWYKFGDEGSIRLLWVTCLVLLILVLKLLMIVLSPVCKPKSWNQLIWMRKHQKIINWIVLAVLFAFIIVFVIVDVVVTTKNYYNLISLCGIVAYLKLMFLFSVAPHKVKWQTVLWGIALQFVFALIVLRWTAGYTAFQWLGDRFTEFLAYSDFGAEFVFGKSFRDHFVAFSVLPVIVFLSSVVSVLFYWGVMQYLIRKMAWVMQFTMRTTAAESLNAAANIFLGMADAPLAIRPMLAYLTKSEIHAVMTGGFATIAGSVLAAYILFGVPANHLLSASFMSAPAALAVSKLFYPETKKSLTTAKKASDMLPTARKSHVNFIEAAAGGAANAIALVANIAANLIAFIAILYFVNATLMWFGHRVGVDELTYQIVCSYVLWPMAFLIGVDFYDCRKVAELIGTKTFLTEFIAYKDLSDLINNRKQLAGHVANNGTWYWSGDDVILISPGLADVKLKNGVITERSELISTYLLCGFGSLGAMGIQLGALNAMAPGRRKDFARVVLRALIAGNVACHMTACIAGLFFRDV